MRYSNYASVSRDGEAGEDDTPEAESKAQDEIPPAKRAKMEPQEQREEEGEREEHAQTDNGQVSTQEVAQETTIATTHTSKPAQNEGPSRVTVPLPAAFPPRPLGGDGPFFCPDYYYGCSFEIPDKDKLKEHQEARHSDEKQ